MTQLIINWIIYITVCGLSIVGLLTLADELLKPKKYRRIMEYRIFRLTADNFIKDIGFKPYKSYLNAENVIKTLKKSHPKNNYIIFQVY